MHHYLYTPLFVYLLFVFAVILVRVLWQFFLTGDHGLRPRWYPEKSHAYGSGVLLLIGAALCFVSTLLYAGSMITLLLQPHWGLLTLSFILCFCGVALTSYSQFSMGKYWRIGVDETEQTELVVTGIYAFVRNPIYTGVMVFHLGMLLLLPHWLNLVGVIVLFSAIHWHVVFVEEPYLMKLHGLAFQDYKVSTNMYWPTSFLMKNNSHTQ